MKELSFVILSLAALASNANAGAILGSANGFAVLAGTTVTSTGASTLTGNLGVSPGTAIVGFPPGTVVGVIHAADTAASQGEADLSTAFNYLSGLPINADMSGTNLGGLTLTQGVYKFDSSAELTGTLTLSGTGTFVFQIGTALTADNNSAIILSGGADPSNIYFAVGSSETVGTGAALQGEIVALQSISLATGSTLTGGALAINGAVTLEANSITVPSGSVPEPGTATLFGFGMTGILAWVSFRRKICFGRQLN